MGGTLSWFLSFFQSRYVALQPAPVQRDGSQPAAVATGVAGEASATTSPDSKRWVGDYRDLPAHAEALFFGWLAGHGADQCRQVGDQDFARRLLNQLDVLASSELAGADLVPRVPTVMVQLLKRSHDDNVTDSDLSRLIAQDVVLVAALLNEVNSSYYKTNKQVTDLNQAIMMLGHNRLRLVLARLSFTPVFNDQLGGYTRQVAAAAWEQSQSRALACHALAKDPAGAQCDPFLTFLCGLAQQVGMVVALRIMDRLDASSSMPVDAAFRLALMERVARLSARIADYWEMPAPVVQAIAALGQSTSIAADSMAGLVRQANLISQLLTLVNASELELDMDRMRDILDQRALRCLTAMQSGQLSLAKMM